MVDIKTDWNEQNLKEYVKYTVFLRNKTVRTSLIFFVGCGAFTLAFCLIIFFIFNYILTLIFAGTILLLAIGFFAFFSFSIKSSTKKILKVNAGSELNRVMISEEDIVCFNDDEPIGTISWSKMTDIYFNEKIQTAYLTTERNAALILECSNILLGTADELKEIIGKKRDELSKKT